MIDHVNGKDISTLFFHPPESDSHFFETVVLDENDAEIYVRTYDTKKESEEGHKGAIEWVKKGCISYKQD